MSSALRIGTRRSRLALAQTDLVVRALARRSPRLRTEVVPLVTSGDRRRGRTPDFTDSLERALEQDAIDVAVHSAKDLNRDLRPGLTIAATLPRADPRDAFVRPRGASRPLPADGVTVGSSSPRRRAQLLRGRPGWEVVELRGNVDRRLDQLDHGRFDVLCLAVAGLERLGAADRIAERLPVGRFVPSPGQGTIALEVREDDRATLRAVQRIDHPVSRARLTAERAAARAVDGDCDRPFGALAVAHGRRLDLIAEALSSDGRRTVRVRASGSIAAPSDVGRRAGAALTTRGAHRLWA